MNIIYRTSAGQVAVMMAPDDANAEALVPAGAPWRIAASLPAEAQERWVWTDSGEIAVASASPAVPALVSKLALVKAMREIGMDGQPVAGVSVWDQVKAAIAAAGGDVEEDWQLANFIPRSDPTINALAAQLVPTDPPRQQLLDWLFTRAGELE